MCQVVSVEMLVGQTQLRSLGEVSQTGIDK